MNFLTRLCTSTMESVTTFALHAGQKFGRGISENLDLILAIALYAVIVATVPVEVIAVPAYILLFPACLIGAWLLIEWLE